MMAKREAGQKATDGTGKQQTKKTVYSTAYHKVLQAMKAQGMDLCKAKREARKAAKARAQHAQRYFRYLEGLPLLFRII